MNILYSSVSQHYNYQNTKNHSDFCTYNFSVLIREVVGKRLSLYERKEDRHSSLKPEDGLSGPGGMRDPPVGYEFQDHGASQAQRPLPDTDSLQRTPYDAMYMERVSSQDRKLMEEEDEQTNEEILQE